MEVTTECGHTFHFQCAKDRVIKEKKSSCPNCRKPSVLGEALARLERKMADDSDRSEKKIPKRVSFSRRFLNYMDRIELK